MFSKLNIFRSDFVRNVFTLMTGTVLAQGISVLLSPVLSRMFTPEEFGSILLFLSIAGAFSVIATARYEKAIVIPASDKDGLILVKLSVIASFLVGFLNLILVLIFLFFFSSKIELSGTFRIWLFLMPVFTILFGYSQAITNWFIRKKAFKAIAYSKLINSVSINLILLLLGLLSFGFWGLFIGNFAGLLFLCIYLFWIFRKNRQNRQNFSYPEIKEQAIKYKAFPITNSGQAIIEMFQMNGIIYMLGIFFSTEIVGLYSFSLKVLMAPMWIIGTSISQVFFQKASEIYKNNGDLKLLYKKTAINSSIIALPILIILVAAGPQIFSFVFGKEWTEAGEYARILAPWIFLDFVKAPLSQIPLITGKIKHMFQLSLIGNIILIISMLFGGIIAKDVTVAFIALSVSMCVYIIGLLVWIYKVSEKNG